jgi:predicted thioesterase
MNHISQGVDNTEGMPAVAKSIACLSSATNSTEGMNVDIDHLAATPTGSKVNCKAQVLRIEDNKIHFKIEAFDEHEKVASGLHKLAVVDKVRLAKRVERKQKKI